MKRKSNEKRLHIVTIYMQHIQKIDEEKKGRIPFRFKLVFSPFHLIISVNICLCKVNFERWKDELVENENTFFFFNFYDESNCNEFKLINYMNV